MIRIQNVCGKAILLYLITIMVGAIYDGIICSKIPLRVLASIKEVKEALIYTSFSVVHRYQKYALHCK